MNDTRPDSRSDAPEDEETESPWCPECGETLEPGGEDTYGGLCEECNVILYGDDDDE